MKRSDLKALGLAPEQIDRIMTLNGNDINRERRKAEEAPRLKEVQRLHDSCTALLDMLNDPEDLRNVLLHISRLYREQCRKRPVGCSETTRPQNDPQGVPV